MRLLAIYFMKEPTRTPFFACLYHGLCVVAREHGYALAIHGTVVRDMDLIAVPWTNEAVEPETLVAALKDHLGACDYEGLLRQHKHLTDDMISQILAREGNCNATDKPHGRKAWNLYLYFGAKVDLSVMPILSNDQDHGSPEHGGDSK